MYEPAEDSELLGEIVAQRASGRVLDLGTGSGYLADIAHKRTHSVIAVDIDPDVVRALKSKPYPVVQSDRFTSVHGAFDTIICNPPYLPDDKERDQALHGGPKGYEYILNVLEEARSFLTAEGQLLFLISSLTRPAVVEHGLERWGYTWERVAQRSLFMETLLVYRATLLLGEPAELIGKGSRSRVYATREGAVKISSVVRARKEGAILALVNTRGIGPKLWRVEGDRTIMERVSGERFDAYMQRTRDLATLLDALRQARVLDELGVTKQELARPGKNVLVGPRGVVLLDFERSTRHPRPGNVTQLASWAGRFLHRDVRAASAVYKRQPSEAAFQELLAALVS